MGVVIGSFEWYLEFYRIDVGVSPYLYPAEEKTGHLLDPSLDDKIKIDEPNISLMSLLQQ